MKVLLARFLLAFMLVWLPLQAYAAQSMPVCRNHHHAPAPVMHQGCHEHHQALHATAQACDDCGDCHLYFQPALILAPFVLVDTGAAPEPAPTARTFTPVVPEQPQRPPLPLFS